MDKNDGRKHFLGHPENGKDGKVVLTICGADSLRVTSNAEAVTCDDCLKLLAGDSGTSQDLREAIRVFRSLQAQRKQDVISAMAQRLDALSAAVETQGERIARLEAYLRVGSKSPGSDSKWEMEARLDIQRKRGEGEEDTEDDNQEGSV